MQPGLLVFKDRIVVGLIGIAEMPGEGLAFLEHIRCIAVP